MKGGRIEDGNGAVLGLYEQGDLRTAQDDAFSPPADQVIDDQDIGPPRVLADKAVGELVVDDVVNGRPSGLVGD